MSSTRSLMVRSALICRTQSSMLSGRGGASGLVMALLAMLVVPFSGAPCTRCEQHTTYFHIVNDKLKITYLAVLSSSIASAHRAAELTAQPLVLAASRYGLKSSVMA